MTKALLAACLVTALVVTGARAVDRLEERLENVEEEQRELKGDVAELEVSPAPAPTVEPSSSPLPEPPSSAIPEPSESVEVPSEIPSPSLAAPSPSIDVQVPTSTPEPSPSGDLCLPIVGCL